MNISIWIILGIFAFVVLFTILFILGLWKSQGVSKLASNQPAYSNGNTADWRERMERREQENAAIIEEERTRATRIIQAKLPELRREKRKCSDRWVEVKQSCWAFKQRLFVSEHLIPSAGPFTKLSKKKLEQLVNEVEACSMDVDVVAELSGAEYEIFCADLLRGSGWDVQQTKASGDQGVDLLACRNGARIAVQCKCYSGAVSNKAVQEVVAGAHYYQTTKTVVVSTGVFTASAKELAKTTGTILIHHDQIHSLDDVLGSYKVPHRQSAVAPVARTTSR